MKMNRIRTYENPEANGLTGTITLATIIEDFKNGVPRDNLRLTIAVDPFDDYPIHDFRVRADYWGSNAEGLLPDMYRILGPDIVHLTDEEGNIIPEHLEVLKG